MKQARNRHILLGVHQFFPEYQTGTEVLTLELARGLRKRNHTVHILTCVVEHKVPYTVKPWLTFDEYDGFPVHRLHYGVSNWNKIVYFELSNLDRITIVKDLIASIKPDIVHFNHLIGFTGKIIPEIKKMGIPAIFTATDFWAVCPAYTLYKRFSKRVCEPPVGPVDCLRCLLQIPALAAKIALQMGRTPLHKINIKVLALHALDNRQQTITECINAADAVFVSTRFLKNILIKGGINEKRIKIIPYGIDVGDLPESLLIPLEFSEKNPLRLGFIGTLSEKKGAHVLLDAIAQSGDKKIELFIYGNTEGDNPYCKVLFQKAEPLGNKVCFKGTFPHEKIGEILRGIHILVIPSVWYESSPLVLTSALNTGVPLIVSDLGGLTEMIHGGDYGFSFPPGDEKKLGSIIYDIADKPELLRKIRENMKGLNRITMDYVNEVESEYLKILL
jgi:glycosyltransferase involved in cell wall biosynthesis